MRVWVDVLTPKQVLFFSPLIEELRAHDCEVLATSRRYREIEPLAKMQGLDLTFVGERGGSSPAEQLIASTERMRSVIPVVSEFRPDASVSVASSVCARVSFGLGVRHIAVNDSPHSTIAGRLALPLSHHLLCPWIIPYSAWAPYGLGRKQITRYRALDPAAWLKRRAKEGALPSEVSAVTSATSKKKTITVRLEESFAPYMRGTDKSWNDAVLGAVADGFPDCSLVALCRYGEQLEHVKREFGSRYIIPEEAIDGRGLLKVTDVFVGLGGTMTAESALMGVPTISTFQGTLYTERYLKSVGLLKKTREPKRLVVLIGELLKARSRAKLSHRAKRVLNTMEDPVPKVAGFIEKTAKQA
jgi:predicted glycosyltransferase